ncbi:hypothetical protein BRARA_A02490 [Brassica rapa]|uniref:RNase H type-1 domain-containing protein n=1 Tax=Brassica campestris TaxID=3711 RepID=A0A398AVX1_BRACM|nr:hypothetical protein BRARA_A02490 [Brassica rapa]
MILEFNLAILGKQSRRLVQFLDSLLAKVLQGKYFICSSPLPLNKAHNPSYGWTSTMVAKPLISLEIRQKVNFENEIRIWEDRNFLLFRKQILQPNVTVDNACADVREWISHLCSSSPTVSNTSAGSSLHALSSWKRPDQGFLKCNYDAAYDLNSNQVRGAWIIRNCYGHPYMWGSANLGFANSSLVAETMALLVAMQNAWIGGYSDMIFEGDSEILVTTINDHLTNYNLLEEINSLKNKLSTTTFTFVKRNGNQAAHEIVRHGPANSIFENCKVYPPKWLTPTLYSDIMLSY